MVTATAPTSQHDLDYARSICLEMADDFRFTTDDIDADLLRGATEYARQYTGSFDFMREMHVASLKRAWLTEGQAKGVLNCMMADVRRCRRAEAQAATPPETVDFSGLQALFSKAGAHLKYPKIRLRLGFRELTISRAVQGQHPGSINFRTGSFDDGCWYGRVEPNGTLTPSKFMTDEVHDLILELAVDPVAAARRYAHLTGFCCFCGRKLDDERSTAAGYGPICADHYGLPWGE